MAWCNLSAPREAALAESHDSLSGPSMTSILGISAFYHDSAACIVVDGDIVAAAQEERFSREKYDANFPSRAVDYCLSSAGLTSKSVDYVAFYDKPIAKFDRLLETYLSYAPLGFQSWAVAMPVWLRKKIFTRRVIRKALGPDLRAPIVFLDHHESHAASAFFPSPFDEAAILTLDGVGEWSTASYGRGSGNTIELTHELRFPHSLGLLYSAFTYYCGFKVNSGEYKLMGLAPYGRPVYRDVILQHLVDLNDDGSLWLNMEYFNYCQGLTMTGPKFDALFGGPPRKPESTLEQRHMDLAASIQRVTEECVLRMGRRVKQVTGSANLVMAGGVALNCVANGRLQREGPFENVWIQPAAGDAGGALGAALFVWHQLLGGPRPARRRRYAACQLVGTLVLGGRDRCTRRREARAARAIRGSGGTARARSGSAGTRKGRGVVPRARRVRPARAGSTEHPWRRAVGRDAGHHQSQDQVP